MQKIKEIFKNRSWSFYAKLSISVIAVIASIVFIIIEKVSASAVTLAFKDQSMLAFVCMFIGGLIGIATSIFRTISFLDFIPALLYGLGTSFTLYSACFPYTDLAKGVSFFTTNDQYAVTFAILFTVFLVIFALLYLASIVLAYMSEDAPSEAKKA